MLNQVERWKVRWSGVLLMAMVGLASCDGSRPARGKERFFYEQMHYLPHELDPSIRIETEELVAEIIDNTGLFSIPMTDGELSRKPIQDWLEEGYYFGADPLDMHYRMLLPVRHLFGYHGIRLLYNKSEKRNVVVPFYSWLNLQELEIPGLELDALDRRSVAGVGRGWPLQMKRKGDGVLLWLDPLPKMQMKYSIEFQPSEPDGIEFSIRFVLGKKPRSGPALLEASWPCYMNAYDDVRFHYPKGASPDDWEWAWLGERPDVVLGDTVDYVHRQSGYVVEDQAFPLGYGRIGEYALVLMLDDPRVQFYVVNNGGHLPDSPVLNPAWDFFWGVVNYPINTPIGFNGKLLYTRFKGADDILARYEEWRAADRSLGNR